MRTTSDRQLLSLTELELRELRDAIVAAERAQADEIAATHPLHRRSATNLVHYLELRRHDVRDLQRRLGSLGLSSLGRAESAVLATVEAVLDLLALLTGSHEAGGSVPLDDVVGIAEGRELLETNADRLLGPAPASRGTRIMVTMPSEAAEDQSLVGSMTEAGMDVARINCAHDDRLAWNRMADHLHATARPDGAHPFVAMDLAGPKLRTGPLEAGPSVVKLSPRRDRLGVVVAPAHVVLALPDDAGRDDPRPDGDAPVLPVRDEGWLRRRCVGDRVHLVDTRGAKRSWTITAVEGGTCTAEVTRTSYIGTGVELCVGEDDDVVIGELPPVEQAHRVHLGDHVVLTRSLAAAAPVAGGPHRIGCTLPEAFDHVRVGHRVWFDDGKVGGVVSAVGHDEIDVEVVDVHPSGAKLKAEKGINLPDTTLTVAALTDKDLDDLDTVAERADIVNLSFVTEVADVRLLQDELCRRDAAHVGIVLKIENVLAFEHLPELLLAAMRSERVGVMIARGDLAVEVGFERLAEVQEEILWACEAAHVPVIWATEVLDTMARTGRPSRAEVTDAAMSVRAECVMLNKGPHAVDAIRALDSILGRMQHHHQKKRSLMRRLEAWDRDPRD